MKLHSGIRVYAFKCTYNSSSWIDDPAALILLLQTALAGITSFSYKRLLISNVKSVSGSNIEIEIDGIIYQTKTKLNAGENDSLIADIKTALNGVSNFTYIDVTVVNDVFREDATTNYPGRSENVE